MSAKAFNSSSTGVNRTAEDHPWKNSRLPVIQRLKPQCQTSTHPQRLPPPSLSRRLHQNAKKGEVERKMPVRSSMKPKEFILQSQVNSSNSQSRLNRGSKNEKRTESVHQLDTHPMRKPLTSKCQNELQSTTAIRESTADHVSHSGTIMLRKNTTNTDFQVDNNALDFILHGHEKEHAKANADTIQDSRLTVQRLDFNRKSLGPPVRRLTLSTFNAQTDIRRKSQFQKEREEKSQQSQPSVGGPSKLEKGIEEYIARNAVKDRKLHESPAAARRRGDHGHHDQESISGLPQLVPGSSETLIQEIASRLLCSPMNTKRNQRDTADNTNSKQRAPELAKIDCFDSVPPPPAPLTTAYQLKSGSFMKQRCANESRAQELINIQKKHMKEASLPKKYCTYGDSVDLDPDVYAAALKNLNATHALDYVKRDVGSLFGKEESEDDMSLVLPRMISSSQPARSEWYTSRCRETSDHDDEQGSKQFSCHFNLKVTPFAEMKSGDELNSPAPEAVLLTHLDELDALERELMNEIMEAKSSQLLIKDEEPLK